MAADLSHWMAIAGSAVLDFFIAVVVVVVCAVAVYVCILLMAESWWQWPRLRLFRLGGVTTLRRKLNYNCVLCRESMEAGEKVRTLSCDHVFHCGATVKCKNDIDQWLRTAPEMSCPLCRQVPHPVLPWKRPPPSSPAPSSSASSASTSTQNLEDGLLLLAHDQTLPEASSSAPAPPLAQLPPTSTPELEEELLPPVHLPEASSSQ